MSKLTIEEHGEWREMENMMQNVTVPLETFFPDRSRQGSGHIFGEVSKVYALRWKDVLDGIWHLVDKDGNYHNVVYNKDLDQPAIVVGPVVCPDHSQDDTLYTIKCQILSPSRFISLGRKLPVTVWTFQVVYIIFLKTKAGLICTWRTL
ncbi:hypothetical protein HKD37_02G003978 [Glycine soja]